MSGWTFVRRSQMRVSGGVGWFVSCPACGREQRSACRVIDVSESKECCYSDCRLSRAAKGKVATATRHADIRRRWAAGERLPEIAADLGISTQRVWQIVAGDMTDAEVSSALAACDGERLRAAVLSASAEVRRRLFLLLTG